MCQLKSWCCNWKLREGTIIYCIIEIVLLIGIATWVNIWEEAIILVDTRLGFVYLYLISSGLLLYGAVKRSRYFMLPWLIYSLFQDLIFFNLVILNCTGVLLLVWFPIYCGMWHGWFCVFSYYHELDPSEAKDAIEQQCVTDEEAIVFHVDQDPVYDPPESSSSKDAEEEADIIAKPYTYTHCSNKEDIRDAEAGVCYFLKPSTSKTAEEEEAVTVPKPYSTFYMDNHYSNKEDMRYVEPNMALNVQQACVHYSPKTSISKGTETVTIPTPHLT